jgi:hypothetical protein
MERGNVKCRQVFMRSSEAFATLRGALGNVPDQGYGLCPGASRQPAAMESGLTFEQDGVSLARLNQRRRGFVPFET